MESIKELRQRRGMSLTDLASRLGVTRATVQAYERSDARGSIRVDTRRRVVAAMGAAEEQLTSDQLRSLLMSTMVAARLLADPRSVTSHAAENLRRWADVGRRDSYWIERWRRALEQPAGQIALLLTERSQDASDMRQGTPFAGVLDDGERLAAIHAARELETRQAREPAKHTDTFEE